jgi:AcrR family transcriptional regulator
MGKRYRRAEAPGFGSRRASPARTQARVKPLKKPAQARARFTVQAIYDAFVRILRRDGWAKTTTRGVALECGISVGTLYEYFPGKLALLSGYVRHCIDAMLERIRRDVVAADALPGRERLARLVRITCALDDGALPYWDHQMLMLEHAYAESKHHRRAYEELRGAWRDAVAACGDLPHRPPEHLVDAAFAAAFGARRYVQMVQPPGLDPRRWLADIERIVLATLAG